MKFSEEIIQNTDFREAYQFNIPEGGLPILIVSKKAWSENEYLLSDFEKIKDIYCAQAIHEMLKSVNKKICLKFFFEGLLREAIIDPQNTEEEIKKILETCQQ